MNDVLENNLLKHLNFLTSTDKPRFFRNVEILNLVAEYIYNEFSLITKNVEYQSFKVGRVNYKNVICSIGNLKNKRIIIGAHYDVCEHQPGADDNASGVAGLIELAKLFKSNGSEHFPYRIDFVAYTLEEPPHFGTNYMGSYQHAKYLYDNKIDVYGMIALEMIGYFSNQPNSQKYPLKILENKYGKVGDFIATVSKVRAGKFVNQFADLMNQNNYIKHHYYKGPKNIKIIGMSDHLNYWKHNFSACMVTDTSYLRNPNYHKITDTVSTLNIPKMALVVKAVFISVYSFKYHI